MKKYLITGGILLALIALFAFNKMTSRSNSANIYTEVKEGLFEITVSNSGELIAEKSLDIYGPSIMEQQQQQQQGQSGRGGGPQGGGMMGGGMMGGGGGRGGDMRAQELKIQDIVPEGTIVKTGDYIAQIDRTSYANTLKDAEDNLKTLQANVDMKILDTAVNLTSLRDDIKNQRFIVEEAEITLAQSKYEPPATIRQAEIALDKAKRSLEQKIKGYNLKVQQNLSDIRQQKLKLSRGQSLVNDLQTFLAKFTVTAPADGMVIYKKDRGGSKRKAGSQINPFDLVIATLPDLSTMISKIYVSEIEVSKVQPGQKVIINVDAFPSKMYSGTVQSVANIGEQLPNSDSKMFEVQIKVDGSDPALRPGMTTGNKIIIKSYPDAIYIPSECVNAGTDSIPFVYGKNRTKNIVVLGESNDKNVIIEKGLTAGSTIFVIPPAEADNFKVVGKELIPEIRSHK